MKVLSSLEELGLRQVVMTIGNFDGVHLGHQVLLERLTTLALEQRKPAVITTFFPPAKVLFQGSTYLSSAAEKLRLLAAYQPAAVVLVPFTAAYAKTSKELFIAQLTGLQPRVLIAGEDFRFGRGRQGSLSDLRNVTRSLEVFAMKTIDGEEVKSSRIRELLSNGEVGAANRLLGRPYLACGRVLAQERRRASDPLGASVHTPPRKALPQGVFAVEVELSGKRFRGVADSDPSGNTADSSRLPASTPLEVHLLDSDIDLAGSSLSIHFLKYLREQRPLPGLPQFRKQLEADRQAAQSYFAARADSH